MKYSVFERGMHWVTLIILTLKSIICALNTYLNKASFADGDIILLTIGSFLSPLFLMPAIYAVCYFRNYASHKYSSSVLIIILVSYLLYDFSYLFGFYFSELRSVFFMLSIFFFFSSLSKGKRIYVARERDETILDDL